MNKVVIIILCLLLSSQISIASELREYIPVSMIQLISNPKKFNDNDVVLKGVLKINSSEARLFFSKEFYINNSYKNSLILDIKGRSEELCFADGHFIQIQGLFKYYPSSKPLGDKLYILELTNITKAIFLNTIIYPKGKINKKSNIIKMLMDSTEKNNKDHDRGFLAQECSKK
ncbi:MAG TPA: hypothetical protein ENJ60_15060 [Aeromonadales bacterium]|nr:hypothetical protein [Aeromonadales bacterium]